MVRETGSDLALCCWGKEGNGQKERPDPEFRNIFTCDPMFLIKEIEPALGRKVLCVGLLVLLAVALSPVAHAKANNPGFHNECD